MYSQCHIIRTLRIRNVTPFRLVECSKSCCKSCSFQSLKSHSCTESISIRAILPDEHTIAFNFDQTRFALFYGIFHQSVRDSYSISGPGCSKLTTSLVNETLKFQTLISQIWYISSKCSRQLQYFRARLFKTNDVVS